MGIGRYKLRVLPVIENIYLYKQEHVSIYGILNHVNEVCVIDTIIFYQTASLKD